ncbi:MAG: hypothetical protein K8I00_09830 [Candidatus Omnitrophica bacterium]|nr:hypothetical protein [Candidatus Omnitrophota bacterium]
MPNAIHQKQEAFSTGQPHRTSGGQDQTELLKQHQANQEKMKEIGLEHHQQMQAATEQFSQDMQNAATNEERREVQQKYQREQQQKLLELQQTIMQLKNPQGP